MEGTAASLMSQQMHKAKRSRWSSCIPSFTANCRPVFTLALQVDSVVHQQAQLSPSPPDGKIQHFHGTGGTVHLFRSPDSHPQPAAAFAILQFQPDDLQTFDFHDCLRGNEFVVGRQADASAQIKKPCADCSVTGPVSLTENLLNLFLFV